MRPRARPSGGLDRHHVVAGDGVLSRLAIVGPGLHELPALLDDGAALVGPLQGIALDVGQAQLDDLPSQGGQNDLSVISRLARPHKSRTDQSDRSAHQD